MGDEFEDTSVDTGSDMYTSSDMSDNGESFDDSSMDAGDEPIEDSGSEGLDESTDSGIEDSGESFDDSSMDAGDEAIEDSSLEGLDDSTDAEESVDESAEAGDESAEGLPDSEEDTSDVEEPIVENADPAEDSDMSPEEEEMAPDTDADDLPDGDAEGTDESADRSSEVPNDGKETPAEDDEPTEGADEPVDENAESADNGAEDLSEGDEPTEETEEPIDENAEAADDGVEDLPDGDAGSSDEPADQNSESADDGANDLPEGDEPTEGTDEPVDENPEATDEGANDLPDGDEPAEGIDEPVDESAEATDDGANDLPEESNTEVGEPTDASSDPHNDEFFGFGKRKADVDPNEERWQNLKDYTNNDVLPKADAEMKDHIHDNGLDKYIPQEKLNERIPDNTQSLTPSEMKEQYGNGWDPSIMGFNDGTKSYVDSSFGPDQAKETAIHENYHQLSANDLYDDNGNIDTYQRGLSINGNDRGLNEALTQKYTLDTMRDSNPNYTNPNCAYDDATKYMDDLYSYGNNKDMFDQAYFQNNPEALRQHFDEYCGDGFYDNMSKNFDVATDNSYSPEYRQNALNNISDSVNEYKFNRMTR